MTPTTVPVSGSHAARRDLRRAEQAATTRRYDRNARFYDLYDSPMEFLGGVGGKRRRLLSAAAGRTLEVGVGTGRNLDLYPAGVEVVGLDISPRMLDRARLRARRSTGRRSVPLVVADVGDLPFPDQAFDTVAATCVFCSVADPVGGLAELARVIKGDGAVLLLEHVRPRSRLWGWVFDRLAPLVRRVAGPEINRRTDDNVPRAGLVATDVRASGVWREMTARRETPR